MRHRIFVALPISRALQEIILVWEQQFSKLPVRWLAGRNLHVTLVPPWYEEDVERIRSLLAGSIHGHRPLDIEFGKVTFGQNPRSPRLIWTEGEAPPALGALKADIEKAISVEPEHRQFLLHLTLARFRPETFSSFAVKEFHERVSWHDTVSSVALMESHLSRQGAEYEVLHRFPLKS